MSLDVGKRFLLSTHGFAFQKDIQSRMMKVSTSLKAVAKLQHCLKTFFKDYFSITSYKEPRNRPDLLLVDPKVRTSYTKY